MNKRIDGFKDWIGGMEVGRIGNAYGGLNIKIKDGKCLWSIEDQSGYYWQEIPEYLYNALMRFQESFDNRKVV